MKTEKEIKKEYWQKELERVYLSLAEMVFKLSLNKKKFETDPESNMSRELIEENQNEINVKEIEKKVLEELIKNLDK